jgi:transcriptional regulator with XRE-family HTH domain
MVFKADHYSLLALGTLVTALFFAIAHGAYLRLNRRANKPKPEGIVPLTLKDDTQLFKPVQGLLIDKIWIDEAVLDSGSPRDVVQAVVDFVNGAMEIALVVPGEFPRQALFVYHMDYYIAQVNNGGHAQFAFNSGMNPQTLSNIENGLKAIEAKDLLCIFKDFCSAIAGEARLDIDALYKLSTLKDLNNRFFALRPDDDISTKSIAWLRRLKLLKPLPAFALKSKLATLKAKNRLFQARQSKLVERPNPLFLAAKRLCLSAGLAFEGITAGKPTETPGVSIWGVRTPRGIHFLRLDSETARLFDHEGKTQLAMIRLPVA